ncbi:hypothetical protein TWF718_011220 [Orbilia javanica]|uniref:Uncharacterized protein n=1 Tax=Orbilia javanica TaxID=47235 RepID=A0AAN8MTE6_9PEZI
MPLLDPSELAALGLSPKDIPAHGSGTPQKNAGHVGSTPARVTMSQPRRQAPNHRSLISTSTRSSKRSTSESSISNSASPTLSTSRFAFEAGSEVGSTFEVCIPVPSRRKLAILQQYERFPDADLAASEEIARPGAENATNVEGKSVSDEIPPGILEDSDKPNESSGTDISLGVNDKEPVLEPEVPIVPIVSDISL